MTTPKVATREDYLLQYSVMSFVSMFLISYQQGVSPEVLAVVKNGIAAASPEIRRLGGLALQHLAAEDDDA